MRPPKADPENMTPEVRYLFEAGLVHCLPRKDLAALLGVSLRTMQGWFAGVKPRAAHEQLIKAASEKLKALPEPGQVERDGRMARTGYRPSDSRAALATLLGGKRGEGYRKEQVPAAEEKFQAQMKRVFEELEPKLTSNEKYVIFVANPGCWQSFIEVLALCRKYGVKIPK